MKGLKLLIIAGLIILYLLSFTSAFDWSDGVFAYYKFDEASGTTAYDSTGRYNGTISGVTVNSDGVINKGYNFDGVNDFINLSSASSLGSSFSAGVSISYWVNYTPTGVMSPFFSLKSGGTSFYQYINEPDEDDTQIKVVDNTGKYSQVDCNEQMNINDGNYHHIVLAWNSTQYNFTLFVDGTQKACSLASSIPSSFSSFQTAPTFGQRSDDTLFFQGNMDEIAIFNRTLNSTDVTELYNVGAGLSYDLDTAQSITVSLDYPTDELTTNNETIYFSSTLTANNVNLSNATTYVYYSNGTLINTNITTVTGDTTNTTYISFEGFTETDDYIWNVYACGYNTTGSLKCNWAQDNFTVLWRPFTINAVGYNVSTYETERQDFSLNITTLDTILSVSARIYYNGSSYTSGVSCSSSNCTLTNELDIPTVTSGENENKTFYWVITTYDGSESVSQTSTSYEQNVTRIHIESCNATLTTQALNLSVWDEQNLSRITSVDFEGIILKYYIGGGDTYRNSTFSNSSASEHHLCISPTDEEYFITGQVDYDDTAGVYTKRNYFFDNHSLTNASEDKKLYLLKTSELTSFIVAVQDLTKQPLPNAYVYIERYYPSEDEYKIVQVILTGDNGEGVGFYETETAEYRHRVVYNGEQVLLTSKEKIFPKEVPYTITLTIAEDITTPWSAYIDNGTITTDISFNKTSDYVTFTYIDNSETVSYGRLYIYKENLTNGEEIVICDETSSLSSAILSCNVSGIEGTVIAKGFLGSDASNTALFEVERFRLSTSDEVFGSSDLIFIFMLLMVVAFIFIWSPVVSMIIMCVVLWGSTIIGILNVQPLFLFAITAVAIILMVAFSRK